MSVRPGTKKKSRQGRQHRVTASKLDKLIEEAIVDCYNESEQIGGIYSMLEDNLDLPFQTEVLGVRVTVERIDLTDEDEIVAICTRDRIRQATAAGRGVDRGLPALGARRSVSDLPRWHTILRSPGSA